MNHDLTLHELISHFFGDPILTKQNLKLPYSINSPKAPLSVGAYPHAKRVGPFLFLSGIGPRRLGEKQVPGVEIDPSNGKVLQYDFLVQCENVFQNLNHILKAAQGDFSHLVDITVFLTNMDADFSTFNEFYGQQFPGEEKPCRTTLEVNSLPTPIAIELKCMAYFP